ncbi:MAG: hypothetical protein CMQ05_07520 [Gammaproteobacteria bacterium]|uniref:Cyclodeaminase/cyclohydrolase domain-containing protein n=1 Tax=OM182 bacterium MED-G24 TaxID=1986255 RepID=A0A2A5X0E4_9GAMM|nr:hypothetical protein [Gammaproteobacteria bacterium]PDH41927.1 MAG: hypothetical protein CNE99_00930 [OM182 bacterium MED-G24]RPG27487.1 MAG: hypothetical protein CBC10_000660 [Gammaproteobacteria bacterium TMED50]|tara:strand:+ start:103 stop:729 length:627 start_codon:yes stop_codon:yes gene_type:complete
MDHEDVAAESLDHYISLDGYLTRLSSNEPVPGGGAAAGVTGAQAAALIGMVCALSEESQEITTIAAVAYKARQRFIALADADMTNFLALMRLYQTPRGSTPADQRRQQIEAALNDAATPPLEMMALSEELVGPLQTLYARGNSNLVTDTGIAAHMLVTTINASGLNVRINLKSMKDATNRQSILNELQRAEPALAELQSLAQAIGDNL